MADTNQSRRADLSDFSENDPFAELTRIMGHDPRNDKPAEAAAEQDYDIDLEKELMGDLDFAEFDEPADKGPVEEPEALSPAPEQSVEAEADASDEAFDALDEIDVSQDEHAQPAEMAAFDDDTPAMTDEEFAQAIAGYGPAESAGTAVEAPEADEQPAAAFEDDLDAALERELLGEADVADDMTDAEQDWLAPGELVVAEEPAAVETPQWQTDSADEAEAGEDAGQLSDADVDFGQLDDVLANELALDPEQPEPVPASSDSLPAWQPEPAETRAHLFSDEQPVDEPNDNLEDQLNALLTDPMPQPSAKSAGSAGDEPAWEPSVSTFGHADFAHAAASPAPQPEPAPAASASFGQAAASPVSQSGQNALLDDDAFAEMFDREMSLDFDDAQPKYGGSAPIAPAPQAAAPEEDALAAWQPEPAVIDASTPPATRAASNAFAPDVETVDVAESARAVEDDLDIPDFEFDVPQPAPAVYDDLEQEFAQAFGSGHADAAAAAPAAMPRAAEWNAAPATAQNDDDPFGFETHQAHATAHFDDMEPGYDTEFEGQAAYGETAAAPAQRSRGVLVAAVVVGVAVIGGIGAFGMSMFGGGSDAPAIVRADTDPMKVKPEDPGGTTVPNQDNEVYQRVAGADSANAPAQETLITTAEEPVDVAAPALAPGVSDEPAAPALAPVAGETGAEAPAEVAAVDQQKSEERLQPTEEQEGVGAANDLLAVTPRKVRTMIVRPDGTMVPREDPTPAPVTTDVASAEPLAAAPSLTPAGTLAPATGLPGGEQAAAEEDAGPVVDTPDTVDVVPTQRSAPQQVAAAAVRPEPVETPAPAVQQPAAQTPAATPVSAPASAAPAAAAATSEWSMQIASQPTSESAQATYQDLAREYGSVLEGRGVNIVRADIEGKGVYYRVRIPAASRDEAIQLCTRYKSAGGSCFVSR